MKKLFLLLAIVGMIVTACTEGEVDETNNPQNPTEQPGNNGKPGDGDDDGTEDPGNEQDTPPQETPVFEIDGEGNYIIGASGGEVEIKVTTNLYYTVSIPEDAKSWLSVADTRAIRNETLTFIAAQNEDNKERQATVSIKGSDGIELQSIVFKQKEKIFLGSISISQSKVILNFEGGDCELSVNAQCSWVATCSADWITLQTPDGIAGDEPLKFTIQRNTALSERKATIILKNENYNLIQEVYVIQSEFAPVIDVVESISLEYVNSEEFIEVTSNVEYDVTDDADWLTCQIAEGGINLSATANGTLDSRSAQVTITPKENPEALSINISVVQEPGEIQYAIYYTSSDGSIIIPNNANAFGAKIIDNKYTNNQGVLIFDAPITLVGDSAFEYCSSLTSIVIPESVIEIGESAFHDCSRLTSVTIPSGVTKIGNSAFYSCGKLTSINIPESVTEIGNSAFSYCTEITSVTIPSGVTEIRNGVFDYCISLTTITIPSGVTNIGESAFSGCGRLTSVTIPSGVTDIGNRAFQDCVSLKNIIIPNRVTRIGRWAFNSCLGLTSITIPDSVTEIGIGAFDNCARLINITIPNNMTLIPRSVFSNCSSLTTITIPDGVTSIDSSAFENCSSLTTITIPSGVTDIGSRAFDGCSNLERVDCKPITPPTGLIGGGFLNNAPNRKIYVPRNSVEAYKSSRFWSEYADDIVGCDF